MARPLDVLPKAHLHLHFSGSMRHSTLLELAARDGIALPDALVEEWPPQLSAADEKGWFRFQRLYDVARSVLRTEDDVRRLVREAAEDDVREGGRWLEIQVDPSGYAARFGGITAFTDLVLETFRLNGRLLATGDRLARQVGLTSARWQVLGALEAGPLPAAGIARRMGLKRQSVQRLVDVLADEGVVAFEENPTHRRAKLVRTTDEGKRRYARLTDIQKEWANRVSRGLDPAALRIATELMKEVQLRLR